ncbi:endospore germination permease [Clostridium sp. PL3]|uniref:Endospore germination permease n=1 Tax=Clostridium thailandense TaxID=2794346 RepID=A0A949TUE8_9CLOT|nr:endospore germination permease [Clostridium thailandense]MBV7275532.1 endospore germination permease [Clostridium thailandense]
MDKLNFKHLFFIICATAIPALKTYPQIFMREAGKDSWICTIIAGIIIIIYFNYICKVCVKNNSFSLYEIYTSVFGKIIGNILFIFFLLTLFLSLFGSASLETNVVHTNLFIESPNWYIALFIVLPGLYVMIKGKNAIMLVLIANMTISIINGTNLYMLTYPFKEYNRLFPIFENGVNIKFLMGIIKALGLYSAVYTVMPYLGEIKEKEKIRRCSTFSLIFVAQMIVISTNGILTTFDVERANAIIYPKLIQTQLISYFGFIASGEFYVIFQVLTGWFAKYMATFLAIFLILKEFNIKRMWNVKVLPYTISGVIYIGVLCITNDLLNLFKYINFYSYMCLINFFIIPVIIFIIFDFKSRRKVPKAQC